jgi:hypothetical protein
VARDCGHWIPLEDPATVIDAIAQMVEDIRARAGRILDSHS